MKTFGIFFNNTHKLVTHTKVLLLFAFVFNVQSFLFQEGSQNLYGQPLILQDTWHFIEGEVDNFYFSHEKFFNCDFGNFYESDEFYFTYGNCFESFTVPYTDLTEESFSLLAIDTYTIGNCTDSDNLNFIDLHNSFFFELPLDTDGNPKNPFSYSVEEFDNYRILTIENGSGDWAVYQGIVLNTTDFSKDSFTLYPNPAKETLHISSTTNQAVNTSIYDLNGTLIQSHSFENKTTTLDIKSFKQGLYFIVFETETGERVSKKFVKK